MISVSLKGAQELRNKIAAMADRVQNLSPAYLRAATVVLAASQMRIRTKDSGSWAPSAETSFGTTLFRTGALMRSLTIGGDGNLYEQISNGVRVGTDLKTPDGLNVGKLMQEGTGTYGPKGTPITPKVGKFLVFEINGQKIFTRSVKGAPARPFLFIDEKDAENVRQVFSSYVMMGNTNGES